MKNIWIERYLKTIRMKWNICQERAVQI